MTGDTTWRNLNALYVLTAPVNGGYMGNVIGKTGRQLNALMELVGGI